MISESFWPILVGALIGIMVGSTLGSIVSYYVIRRLLIHDKLVQEMFSGFREFRKKGFSLSANEKATKCK